MNTTNDNTVPRWLDEGRRARFLELEANVREQLQGSNLTPAQRELLEKQSLYLEEQVAEIDQRLNETR